MSAHCIVFISVIYTERQKKLITSSERRSLKSIASKLIIFGRRFISHDSSLHEAHLKNQREAFVKKERNGGEISKGHF